MRQINDWTTTKAVFLDPIEVVEKLVLVLKDKLIFILKPVENLKKVQTQTMSKTAN